MRLGHGGADSGQPQPETVSHRAWCADATAWRAQGRWPEWPRWTDPPPGRQPDGEAGAAGSADRSPESMTSCWSGGRMLLTPHEQERLMVAGAAEVARRRRERGLLLNHPEAVAVLTAWVLEAARDGMSVAEIMAAGREVLDTSDVMEGVEALIDELQVEATFPDGTKLVTLHGPIQPAPPRRVPPTRGRPARPRRGPARRRRRRAARGPGRGVADRAQRRRPPGAGRVALPLRGGQRGAAVRSRGRRVGRRLAVPAGTSVRFEPGIAMDVLLVAFAGAARHRRLPRAPPPRGHRGRIVSGPTLSRARYAALYGPTVGDRIRLADTDLLIEIEARPVRRAGPGRRRGRLRRRQGHPRVDGPVGAHRGTGRAGPGDHRRRRARPLGDRQGRRRHQGRSHRGARQGRQPRHDGRRRTPTW